MLFDLPEFTVTSPLSYVLLFGCIAGVLMLVAGRDQGLGSYWDQFTQKRKVTHKKRERIDWISVGAWVVILLGLIILAMAGTVFIGCDFQLSEYEAMGLCRK